MRLIIIDGSQEECLAYAEFMEGRKEPAKPPEMPVKLEERVIVPAEPPKCQEEPIRTSPSSKAPLTKEQKAAIKDLAGTGLTISQIKAKLGIADGRQVRGVIIGMNGFKKAAPSIEADIKKLHDIGCTNGEIKQRTGQKNSKLIRQVIGEKVKREIAQEQHQDSNLSLPASTVRRILALDDEKLSPGAISDTLEEEFGHVVSEGEIMDVIVKHAKGMLA